MFGVFPSTWQAYIPRPHYPLITLLLGGRILECVKRLLYTTVRGVRAPFAEGLPPDRLGVLAVKTWDRCSVMLADLYRIMSLSRSSAWDFRRLFLRIRSAMKANPHCKGEIELPSNLTDRVGSSGRTSPRASAAPSRFARATSV